MNEILRIFECVLDNMDGYIMRLEVGGDVDEVESFVLNALIAMGEE